MRALLGCIISGKKIDKFLPVNNVVSLGQQATEKTIWVCFSLCHFLFQLGGVTTI